LRRPRTSGRKRRASRLGGSCTLIGGEPLTDIDSYSTGCLAEDGAEPKIHENPRDMTTHKAHEADRVCPGGPSGKTGSAAAAGGKGCVKSQK